MYRFTVYETESGDFNWRLNYNDKNMCGGHEGPGGFASPEIAIENLRDCARVFGAVADALQVNKFPVGEYGLGRIPHSGIEVKITIEPTKAQVAAKKKADDAQAKLEAETRARLEGDDA